MSALVVSPVGLVNPLWVLLTLVAVMVIYLNESGLSRRRVLLSLVGIVVAAAAMTLGPSIVIQDYCAKLEPWSWPWILAGCGL